METFKKRQKEMLRLERQRDKAAKRLARKQERLNPAETPDNASQDTIAPVETEPDSTGSGSTV